jgi:hypothetical protein
MLLFLTACGGTPESSTASTTSEQLTTVAQSSTSTALADCRPRTVTFEPDADGPFPVTPVLPDDVEALASAVADTFCSPDWKFLLPDATERTATARTVLPSADAACIAGQLIEVLGAVRVKALALGAGPWGLLSFGLSNNSGEVQIERAEAESIVEAFMECSQEWKLLLISTVTEGADKISDESAGCVADQLADDDAKAMLISEIDRAYDDPSQPDAQPFADSIEPLIAAFDDCLSPEERDNLDFN